MKCKSEEILVRTCGNHGKMKIITGQAYLLHCAIFCYRCRNALKIIIINNNKIQILARMFVFG